MDKKRRALVIGCVIGDGHIKIKDTSGTLCLCHGAKQEDYLRWKVEKLSRFFDNNKNANIRKINNNGYVGYVWEKGHKYFRILHKWIYKNKKKTISRRILNFLDAEAIAIWYMDDGSLSYKKRKDKIHAREFTLNTYLTLEENQIIIDYFSEVWGIKFKAVKSKNHYRLRCGGREGWKLIKLIKPFIIPSMQYKIDMKYIKNTKIANEFFDFIM